MFKSHERYAGCLLKSIQMIILEERIRNFQEKRRMLIFK